MKTNTETSIDSPPIRHRLRRTAVLALLGALACAGLLVALAYHLLSTIGRVEQSDRVIQRTTLAQRLSVDMETGMRGFVLSGQENYLEPYEIALSRIAPELDALRRLVADNPAQVARIDRIEAEQKSWIHFAHQMITQRRSQNEVPAGIGLGYGKRITDSIRDEYTGFIDTEQVLRAQYNAEAGRTARTLLGALLCVPFALAALLWYWSRRQIVALSKRHGSALAAHATQRAQWQRQAWLSRMQVELAAELVGETEMPELGRKVLAFFGRRLDSLVGAFYVRERGGTLVRIASYGFSQTAEASQHVFEPGHGLPGQAAIEGRRLLIAPVEADYLRINSGLGGMAPCAVVVLPTTQEGQVNAVIELGMLHEPDERACRLLDFAAGDIGATVAALRQHKHLVDTLIETQQLNEQLRTQLLQAQRPLNDAPHASTPADALRASS